ncbi:MAG: pseudouridylate synthase [Bacteroidales bacterium]|jgi:predicted hotdog family 3-hydroxylacyl-ACP dehydratase|nr:pseudouridylate synthase [Bacteroidales bacterium]
MQEKITDIRILLPQKEPFVMVDALLYSDEKRTTTRFLVKDRCLFCDDGVLSEFGLVENIAQTCAAYKGYVNTFLRSSNVKEGFIGSIKGLDILQLPKVGEQITTTIEVMEEIFNMNLVKAEVRCGDTLLATGEMKIAERDGK